MPCTGLHVSCATHPLWQSESRDTIHAYAGVILEPHLYARAPARRNEHAPRASTSNHSYAFSVAQGRHDNSPAIHRWENGRRHRRVPYARLNTASAVPTGLDHDAARRPRVETRGFSHGVPLGRQTGTIILNSPFDTLTHGGADAWPWHPAPINLRSKISDQQST